MMNLEQMLTTLNESLNQQIQARGLADDYSMVTVQPGTEVAFDFTHDEDCAGIGWVRLVGGNVSTSFPTPAAAANPVCAAGSLAFTVEMGVIGPAPKMEEHMGALIIPSETELYEASMKQARELQMMWDALRSARIPEKQYGTYTPIGPDAGILGGMWTIIVGGDD